MIGATGTKDKRTFGTCAPISFRIKSFTASSTRIAVGQSTISLWGAVTGAEMAEIDMPTHTPTVKPTP